MKRNGIGTKILVALMLALALAAVLTMIVTQASSDAQNHLENASDTFQNTTEEQENSLLQHLKDLVQSGIEAAGMGGQDADS